MQQENPQRPYTEFIKILKPTLDKYNIQLSPNPEESIELLRQMRKNFSHEQFPQMQNNRMLNAFKKDAQFDRAPVWLMRQAGRYLPQFMEISRSFSFFDRCENPFLAAEITLQPIVELNTDSAIIFSDILIILKAIGVQVSMEEKKGPVIHNPLKQPSDIANLKPLNTEYLEHVYDALFLTRLSLQGKKSFNHQKQGNQTLIGFCGGPWTVFSYLVEGGSTRLFAKAKKWLYLWKNETMKVLDLLADCSAIYLINQIRAGAQVVQLFDSWAGDIPTQDYIDIIIPSLVRLGTKVKEAFPNTPIIMFPKGQTNPEIISHFVNYKTENGVIIFDGFNLDHSIDDEVIKIIVKENRTIQGNIEPGVLYGDNELISMRVEQMVKKLQVTNMYVINLAHGLTPDHEVTKVKYFVEEAQRISLQQNKSE